MVAPLERTLAGWVNDPATQRRIYRLARRFKPILRFGNQYAAFRFDDVREILLRHDVFSVRRYDERMTESTGPFLLGMGDTSAYRRERALVDSVFGMKDVDRMRLKARSVCEEIVDRARPHGRIDVVKDLANVVPAKVTGEFFGFPDPKEGELLHWFQTISSWIFNPAPKDDAVRAGLDVGAEARTYFDKCVANRKGELARGDRVPDDMVTRLLRLQGNGASALDDVGIRRTVAGVLSGAVAAPVGLFVHAIDELMVLPDWRRKRLQDAAGEGDRTMIGSWVAEAARLAVFPPVLQRVCEADYVLGQGSRRARLIPRNATVVAVHASAALDPEAYADPETFRPERTESPDIVFGFGQHFCLGKALGRALHEEMASALFSLPNLRPVIPGARAVFGEAGKISVGAAASEFPLLFG